MCWWKNVSIYSVCGTVISASESNMTRKFTPFVSSTYTFFGTIDNKQYAHNQEHPRTPPFDPSHRKYTGRITVVP